MRNLLRSSLLAAAAALGLAAFAQPYTVNVSGHISPCSPAIAGSTVTLQALGSTQPPQTITATLSPNCYYSVNVEVTSLTGVFLVSASCGNGMMTSDSVFYTVTPPGPVQVVLDLNGCGSASTCAADFTVQQAMDGGMPVPWTITTTNLSTGTPPLSYNWGMPDGSISTEAGPGFTFSAPGVYGICLSIAADNGACTAIHCDTVVVDATGNITIGAPCTPPAITGITGPVTLCSNDSLVLSVSATGTAPLLYYWAGPGITYTDTLSSFAFASATPGTYLVSVANACGTVDGSVTVSVVDAPDAGVGTDNFVCDLNGPTPLISLLDGAPDPGGTWTFGGAPHGPLFDPQADMPGPYLYTVQGTSPCADDLEWVHIIGMPSWYDDADGDGFGDPSLPPIVSCTQPAGYVSNNADDCPEIFGDLGSACDDGDPNTVNDHITIDCVCAGSIMDCLGIPGGNAQIGTACTVPGTTIPGTWSTDCTCVPDTPGCHACIITAQDSTPAGVTPFTAQFSSCSTGEAPLTYLWDFGNGSTSNLPYPLYQYSGPGTYLTCLTITDNSGCTSFTCDTLVIDANGTISPFPTPDCEAGFWTIQAYDSTAGGVTPIPNEVWVWNLSSGGNGNYQFQWSFGDGTGSTDPFPTHTYSGPGPWLLCLTMHSGNCTDTYCDSVSVDEDGILNGMMPDGHGTSQHDRSGGFTLNVIQQLPTGIAETAAITDLKTWPNPVDDLLHIAFHNRRAGEVELSVTDPLGRAVLSQQLHLGSGSNLLQVPTDQLAPGLYIVRIGQGPQGITQRFLKVR